jgi:glycosyltransferase involved in cell wall biosynthesis
MNKVIGRITYINISNMYNKKISIIMPTFNRAYIIWKAILSVQAQSHSNWELIVVDDNSTDDTEKLMREFKSDARIKYVKNKFSHSPAGARKQGYQIATGEYIAYLDSDNTAYPTWLENVLLKFNTNDEISFIYSGINFKLLHLVNGEMQSYKEESVKYPFAY